MSTQQQRMFALTVVTLIGILGGGILGMAGASFWALLLWAFIVMIHAVAADERILYVSRRK